MQMVALDLESRNSLLRGMKQMLRRIEEILCDEPTVRRVHREQ